MGRHIKHSDRIGESKIMNNGMKATIIAYRKSHDIDVQFEDGYICYNKSYTSFNKGNIKNYNIKNKSNTRLSNRIGEEGYNKCGTRLKIIEYNNCDNIIVELDNGFKIKTKYSHFKTGNIKTPYDKSVYKHGYIGESKIEEKSYKYWSHMMERCFSEKFKNKNICYKDVICCNEWVCYSNFKIFFEQNYYEIEGERMHLDKDILYKGNKIYSPKTCVFVPQRINSLFTKSNAIRGDLPIGVKDSRHNKFVASCAIAYNNYKKSKDIHIGTFNTPEEAFNAYKTFKENYIKQVADDYKNKIPKKLYEAMYNWEVEITD